MTRILMGLLLLCSVFIARAQQIAKEDYLVIDDYVMAAGPMKEMSLGAIVDSITAKCTTELEMLRAMYCWSAKFISFDSKAFHHPGQAPATASAALMTRKATSEGYARLFEAMCALKHIKCSTVSGNLRNRIADIGTFNPSRHFWNIAEIDNTRFLVDACLGAGRTDETFRNFIPAYTDAWWLTTRISFAFSHFPDHPAEQLLEIPLNRTEFSQAPLVQAGAIISGVLPGKKLKGVLKGREDTSTLLKFNLIQPELIRQVSLSYDAADPGPIDFTADEFGLQLRLPYGPEGTHTVGLWINNMLSFSFRTEARPAPKKAQKGSTK